jgi:hypothetical protein
MKDFKHKVLMENPEQTLKIILELCEDNNFGQMHYYVPLKTVTLDGVEIIVDEDDPKGRFYLIESMNENDTGHHYNDTFEVIAHILRLKNKIITYT